MRRRHAADHDTSRCRRTSSGSAKDFRYADRRVTFSGRRKEAVRSSGGAPGIGWYFGAAGALGPDAFGGPIVYGKADHVASRNGGHPLLRETGSRNRVELAYRLG
jgi:hypothetical protein